MDRRNQLLLGSIWNNKKDPACCPAPSTGGSGFLITHVSDDFEGDGVTLLDSRLIGKDYEIFLNELNRFLISGDEFNILSGGFEVTLSGFDATTNDYHLFIFIK